MFKFLLALLLGMMSFSLIAAQDSVVPFLPANLQPISVDNVTQLQLLGTLGRGMAQDVAWSPDGRSLAVATTIGVWLYDDADLDAAPHLITSDEKIGAVAFSPDSQFFAIVNDSELQLWQVETEELVRAFPIETSPDGGYIDLVFSPDGNSLYYGHYGTRGYIHALDRISDETFLSIRDETIEDFDMSPDGHLLASVGGLDNQIHLWDAQTGLELTSIQTEQRLTEVAFNADGTQLTVFGLDGQLYVWDVQSRQLINTFESYYHTTALAFSPDGETLLASGSEEYSCSSDDSFGLKAWATQTGELESSSPQYTGCGADQMAFSPDGSQIALIRYTDVEILDVANLSRVVQLSGYNASVYDGLAFSPNRETLASLQGDLILWDMTTGDQTLDLTPAYETSVIAFHPQGRWIATSSGDNVQVWDTQTQALATQIYTEMIGVSASGIYFTTDGRQITLAVGNSVLQWNFNPDELSPTVVLDFNSYNEPLFLLTATGDTAYTASSDDVIGVWDIDESTQINSLEANTNRFHIVVSSPDGTWLVAENDAGSVTLWDVANGTSQRLEADAGEGFGVGSAAFTSDNAVLATASPGNWITFWDVNSGELLDSTRAGHTDYISTVVFSPDRTLLATGSIDGTIRLWGVPSE